MFPATEFTATGDCTRRAFPTGATAGFAAGVLASAFAAGVCSGMAMGCAADALAITFGAACPMPGNASSEISQPQNVRIIDTHAQVPATGVLIFMRDLEGASPRVTKKLGFRRESIHRMDSHSGRREILIALA